MRAWMRWLLLAAVAAVLTPLSTTPARADDPVPCATLFPVDAAILRLPAGVALATCVLRDDFTVHSSRYRVAEIAGARTRDLDAQIAAIREATERSALYYGRWFRTAPTTILLGDFGSADAGATTTDGRNGCVISIENAVHHTGRTLDRDDLMRTIAHELFHCVQMTDPELHHEPVKWRDEGTAEYFSGLVIPDAPYNDMYGENLAQIISQPLYTLDESAAPFIFYLGQIRGPEAVANMLQGAFPNTTPEGSIRTLRNIPEVDQLFHDFIRAWIDGRLHDPNGRPIAVPVPEFPPPIRINDDQRLDLGPAPPFQVSFATYEFVSGVDWIIEASEDATLMGAWRRAEDSWLPLPATVDSCEETRGGLLIMTSAAASTEASPRVTRARQSRELRVCRCPLGSWTIPFEDLRYTTYRGAFPEAEMTSGSVTVTVDPDGTMTGVYHNITYEAAIDRYSGMVAVLSGMVRWRWEALAWDERLAGGPPPREPHLMLRRVVTDVHAEWHVQFVARGRLVGERRTPFRDVGEEGSVNMATVVCRGPRLTIGPTVTAPPPLAPPPWYGSFNRHGG